LVYDIYSTFHSEVLLLVYTAAGWNRCELEEYTTTLV